jgi:hypothetical protein
VRPHSSDLLRSTLWLSLIVLAAPPASGQANRATPGGYWEGTVSAREIPMKDANKTMTRSAEAEFWFTVTWDPKSRVGVVIGEAEAKYDAELKVENLPKVTVPAPGGATVKFEPSVGGKLTDTDNRRKFPIVGVITVDESGNGTLVLAKGDPPKGTRAQQLDQEAKGGGPDAPMEFLLRADPGVSGGISGRAGSLNYDASTGKASGSANFGGLDKGGKGDSGSLSQGASTGMGTGDVILKKIPMQPFSPFMAAGGTVVKRPGGPFAASFEDKSDKHTVKWTAKQMGGEQGGAPRITPEMQQQIDDMRRRLRL